MADVDTRSLGFADLLLVPDFYATAVKSLQYAGLGADGLPLKKHNKTLYYFINTNPGDYQVNPNYVVSAIAPSAGVEDFIVTQAFAAYAAATGLEFKRTLDRNLANISLIELDKNFNLLGLAETTANATNTWKEVMFKVDHPTLVADDKATITHEIGHALGLSHPRDAGNGFYPYASSTVNPDPAFTRNSSVMSYNSVDGDKLAGNYLLTDVDKAALNRLWIDIYGSGSALSNAAFTFNKSLDINLDSSESQDAFNYIYGTSANAIEVAFSVKGNDVFQMGAGYKYAVGSLAGNNVYHVADVAEHGYLTIYSPNFATDVIALPGSAGVKFITEGFDTRIVLDDPDATEGAEPKTLAVIKGGAVGGWTQSGQTVFDANGAANQAAVNRLGLGRFIDPLTGIHQYASADSIPVFELSRSADLESLDICSIINGGDILYAFKSKSGQGMMFTLDAAEAAAIKSQSDLYSTIPVELRGYQAGSSLGTSDVYRFLNTSSGEHFFTVDSVEASGLKANPAAGFSYEGIAWRF